MINSSSSPELAVIQARLARLLSFVEMDPSNLNLLDECAQVALEAGEYVQCGALLQRCALIQPLSAALVNLRGLLAMAETRFEDALADFATLMSEASDPVLQYNAGYALAMLGRFEQALTSLDDIVLEAVPAAIPLKMQTLLHLAQQEEAITLGRRYTNHPVVATEIRGLLAMTLFDEGDLDAAREAALVSQNSSDSQAVLGAIHLSDAQTAAAHAMFDKALIGNPQNGRALLGRGLAYLSDEDFVQAASLLDQGALSLKTYPNAWVAAGWSYLLAGKLVEARNRFEQAVTVDRGFAESHGALAVLCIYEKKPQEAARLAEVASRLNPSCMAASLAKAMLLSNSGQSGAADSLMKEALNSPIRPDGMTIAQAMARHMTARSTTTNQRSDIEK